MSSYPIFQQIVKLTAQERLDLFNQIKESYCEYCGCDQHENEGECLESN